MANKEKKIPENKYRIIKISEDALFEFLRESIIDSQKEFFDISDDTSIVTCFDIDWENKSFICVARNELGQEEHLQFPDIDTEKLLLKLKDTTSTLYMDNRYIELTSTEIEDIQNGISNQFTK
ncbi:MAG: hypothetical protein PUB00_05815 [Clostridiales bacterium]|nr:hypothetical protein [Clostridiales bacterium]